MDANWRPVQGSNPSASVDPNTTAAGGDWRAQLTAAAGGDWRAQLTAAAGGDWRAQLAAAAGGDWRAQLDPESRTRIAFQIFEVLRRNLPLSVPEGVNELQRIAVRFEENIYTAAISEPDYLRRISLKMLSMETTRQQAPGNAQVVPNQNNPNYTRIANPHHGPQLVARAGVQPPAGVDLNAPALYAGGDWRAQLDPESRGRILNQILETLKRHLPVSGPDGLNELQKIAVRFEEKIYTAATSQPDYMRKISLKMQSLETRTQQAPGNAQVIPNQYNPNQGGWI
ncbi:unnamed protein product [Alopecurus aequalis]